MICFCPRRKIIRYDRHLSFVSVSTDNINRQAIPVFSQAQGYCHLKQTRLHMTSGIVSETENSALGRGSSKVCRLNHASRSAFVFCLLYVPSVSDDNNQKSPNTPLMFVI